jgi:osmoprotectant transport system ATP-binding protein
MDCTVGAAVLRELAIVFQPVSAPNSIAGTPHDSARVIEFRSVTYRVGTSALLQDVNFPVQPGETLVLLGRSGAGKSTALKLINRLLAPTDGEVLVQGRSTMQWDAIALRRSIGWVMQESGLFPHYSVERNIATVPKLQKWPAVRIAARVGELMQLVGLDEDLCTRFPHQLSGGQRQRVGVARALAADPQILLMDEPFGALDPITRAEVQRQFLGLQRRLRKTVVLVTHDLAEALLLGSRIALFEAGHLTGVYEKDEFARSDDPQVKQYREAFHAAALAT